MLGFTELYSWVKDLPIVDWHNHLDLDLIAADEPLGSLYEVWVKADPYKHRAMRICGEPEELITISHGRDARGPSGNGTTGVSPVACLGSTGDAGVSSVACRGSTGATGVSPVAEPEKWSAWMRTLPKLVGNPIFVWARMELEFLGLDPEPYLHGRGRNVSLSDLKPLELLKMFNVEWLCPCADNPGQRASRQLAMLANPGPRASRPLAMLANPGQRASRSLMMLASLGQRASRPLQWTASAAWFSPTATEALCSHFSHTLRTGDYHRRSFPHIGQDHALMFVTFRLGDSLPAEKLAELEGMRREQQHSNASDRLCLSVEQIRKIDAWLDAGHGSCVLADPRCRKIVEDAFAYFDASERHGQDARGPSGANSGPTGVSPVGNAGEFGTTGVSPVGNCGRPRYRLHAYVVMPNHVHVLMELFDASDLPRVLHSWKSYTAKAINRELGLSGPIWREEYYDRLIRDGEHYRNVLAYIRENEVASKGLAVIRACHGQDARGPSGANSGRSAAIPTSPPSTGGASSSPVATRDFCCSGSETV